MIKRFSRQAGGIALALAAFAVLAMSFDLTAARASTEILTVPGEVTVKGDVANNTYRIYESTTNINPPGSFASAFVESAPAIEATTSGIAAGLTRFLAQPLILYATATLVTFAAVLATPSKLGEEEQTEGALVIENWSLGSTNMVKPCRSARLIKPSTPPVVPVGVNIRTTPVVASCPIYTRAYDGYKKLFVHGEEGRDTTYLQLRSFDSLETRTVWAGPGDDLTVGSDFSDNLSSGSGNDIVLAGDGGDEIWGENLAAIGPTLQSERDSDKLYGEAGPDMIFGGRDSDIVDGGPHDDAVLRGVHGLEMLNRNIRSVISEAALQGGTGDDTVVGGGGVDSLEGGPGRDFLHSQEGDFDAPEVTDKLVDCEARLFGTPDERGEFFRRSRFDVVDRCTTQIDRRVGRADLDNWLPGTGFPWTAGF